MAVEQVIAFRDSGHKLHDSLEKAVVSNVSSMLDDEMSPSTAVWIVKNRVKLMAALKELA